MPPEKLSGRYYYRDITDGEDLFSPRGTTGWSMVLDLFSEAPNGVIAYVRTDDVPSVLHALEAAGKASTTTVDEGYSGRHLRG